MTVSISGTLGITDVNGTAAAPAITGTDTDSGMYFGTNVVALATNGTNAVYVDASQNVGIGTTSPRNFEVSRSDANTTYGATAAQFPINVRNTDTTANNWSVIGFNQGASSYVNPAFVGAQFASSSAAALVFGTSSTERMRIDSSGNLLVNSTSQVSSEKFSVTRTDNNANVVSFKASSTTFNNDILQLICSRSGATTEYNALTVFSNNTGTLNLLIRANGNVQNLNNSYGAISDQSIKENIVDATPKLADLMKVQVRNYNLKADELKTKQLGVVAQELETVFPSMIEEDRDGIKGVKYSVFVPILIKAIQEQQAIIQSLTDRITQLEKK